MGDFLKLFNLCNRIIINEILKEHVFNQEGKLQNNSPNVFYNNKAIKSGTMSEPHHRWSSGVLYDNISVEGPGAYLAVLNRGNFGSGHGWAGAQTIF